MVYDRRLGKLKKNGRAELKDSLADFETLVEKCADIGFHILEVGELESWSHEVPRGDKSDRWLASVFEKYPDLAELKEACAFVKTMFPISIPV